MTIQTTPPNSILFVCLGNICRSPSAEGVMRQKCQNARLNILLDSAGTANYHTGEKPDERAIKVGAQLGYDLSALRARQVHFRDFYQFDIIFAMDASNLQNLHKLQQTAITHANGKQVAKLQLFDPQNIAVADPYYGDDDDFRRMFAHIERIAEHHISTWKQQNPSL